MAFIFDIDGTIIDSMPWHGRAWQVFVERHGLAYGGDAFLRRTAGRTGVELMRELFGPLDDAGAWTLVQEKEAVYRELFEPSFREIAGFRQFARRAKADGIPLACATAGDADNIAFALRNLGMEDAFDAVAGGHEVSRGKPAPDLFLLAAGRIGVDPAACIVFEDAPLGVEGARRAGMHCVAVTSGESAQALSGPHVIAVIGDYDRLEPRRLLDLAGRARAGTVTAGRGSR